MAHKDGKISQMHNPHRFCSSRVNNIINTNTFYSMVFLCIIQQMSGTWRDVSKRWKFQLISAGEGELPRTPLSRLISYWFRQRLPWHAAQCYPNLLHWVWAFPHPRKTILFRQICCHHQHFKSANGLSRLDKFWPKSGQAIKRTADKIFPG